MEHQSNKTWFRPALTMPEVNIAIAVMAILFAYAGVLKLTGVITP